MTNLLDAKLAVVNHKTVDLIYVSNFYLYHKTVDFGLIIAIYVWTCYMCYICHGGPPNYMCNCDLCI